MRKRIGIILTLSLLCAGTRILAQQSGEDLFRQAVAMEKSEGNPKGAIEIYERILADARFSKDSTLIARTLIQLGGCYDDLNQPARAREFYQRVIDEYGASPEAKVARDRTGPLIAGTSVEIATPFTGDYGLLSFAISPDGRRLVYQATINGKSQLWMQDLKDGAGDGEPRPLRGTEGGFLPFWKPNSQAIGFFANNKLKTVGIEGGEAREITDVSQGGGGSWNSSGVLIFSTRGNVPSNYSWICRVPESGGARNCNVTPHGGADSLQFWPRFLADGNHFVYYRLNGTGSDRAGRGTLVLGSLDSNTVTPFPPGNSATDSGGAAMSGKDQLVYVQDASGGDTGILSAQRFDGSTPRLGNNVQHLADRVGLVGGGGAALSVSDNGLLAYRSKTFLERRFVWFDRHGNKTGDLGPVDRYGPFRARISPDGKTVLYLRNVGIRTAAQQSLWRIDNNPDSVPGPIRDRGTDVVWSPQGDEVIFSWMPERNFATGLLRQALDGLREPTWVLPNQDNSTPYVEDWSANGFLLYTRDSTRGGVDLYAVIESGGTQGFPIAANPAAVETAGRFSPNGRLIAYLSNEEDGGRFEIFVQPFSGTSDVRNRVSIGAGTNPRWGRDGRELYFLSPDSRVMVWEVTLSPNGDALVSKPPAPLFPTPLPEGSEFDVTRDGERFLITMPLEKTPPIYILSNWPKAK